MRQVQRHLAHSSRELRLQPEGLQVMSAPSFEIPVVLGHDVPEGHVRSGQVRIKLHRPQRGLPRIAERLGRRLDAEDRCQGVGIGEAGARQGEAWISL